MSPSCLAPYLDISLDELKEAVYQQRGDRPFILTDLQKEVGFAEIVHWLEAYLLKMTMWLD